MSKEIFYVFLSYNTKDGDQVEKIAKFLKGRKIKVWLDKWKVQPGKSLQEALEDGLRRSNVILIFFGKYGVGQWQKEEAKIAIHQAINTGKKVIPIMLPGCPDKPEIPEFLKDKMQIDFRKGLANPEEQENLLWGITGEKTYLENDDVNEKIEKIDTIAKKKIEELKKKHRSPLITLADALSKRNLVLVIGTGINKITGIPTVAELNKSLFKDLDLDDKGEETGPYDPLYIAELYEQEFGQQRLFEQIVTGLEGYTKPSLLHEKIAQINVHIIFTINYDLLLERAFEKNGINYVVINRDSEYSSYQSSDTRCRLIKLHGSVNTPEDIILTRTQILMYDNTHPNFVRSLQDILLTSTVLFLGVDLKEYILENLYIKTLKSIQNKGPRHYIITKGTNEKLIRFYESHNLKTIALQEWDELPLFLDILKQEAEEIRTKKDSINQTGTIILTPPANLLHTSIRHYNEKYTDLRNKFAKGAGETLVADLETLLKELEAFREEDFRTLRCWVYLLLAQISLNRKPQNFDKVSEYLEHAKTLENQQTAEFICVINSLFYFYKGEMEEAAHELELITSNKLARENAFRIQFFIALETEKVDNVLLEQAIQRAKKDNILFSNIALYYTRQYQKNDAIEYITQYLESHKPDALGYMRAAGLISLNAAFEEKQICNKYNLLEILNLFFKHNLLIDKKLILQAIGWFEKAAEKYQELGEKTLEREALEFALRPLKLPDLKSDKEPKLVARLKEIAPKSQYVIMAEKKTRAELADYTTEQFKEIVKENAGDPNSIWLITDWGMATNKIQEALELFAILQNTMESITEKITWTFAQILLLLFAQDRQRALQTAEGLVVPSEYSYIPLLFQAFVHSSDIAGYDKTETLIIQAKQSYKEHPEVLAFSCDYWVKRQNWQALEADAELLFKIAITTQSISYYLEAFHRQGKYLRGIEIIEEAKRRKVDLPETITLVEKARFLINIQRREEALRLYEKAKTQNIPLGPMDEIIIAQLYIHSHRLSDAKVSLEKQKEIHPSPEIYILLSQIEAEQNPQKAFEILDQGRIKYPNHEELLSKYIMLGFTTGHDEEVAPLMAEFTRRFPESKLLRPYPIDDAIEIIKEGQKQAQYILETYRKGDVFALGVAYALPNTSLFRFWKASQLNREGLYISFGEQGGVAQRLVSKYPEPVPVIIEYTALISIWSLWGRTWKNELSKLFSSFLFPESFRTVLTMERSRLFQPEQEERYRAKKKLVEIITDPSTPFKPFEINDHTLSDEENERHYAEEKKLYYLNEYTSGSRYKNEIGFMELAALLRTSGRITANQENKLLKIAKKRDFITIEQLKQQKTDIVVNLVCFTELILLELFEPLLKQFKIFYFLKKEIRFLKQELREYEFRQELKAEFIRFEETIFETDNRIQWFQETLLPKHNKNAERSPEFDIVTKYLLQIGNYTYKKKYPVLSDDRFVKKAIHHPENNFFIGTDSLLQWLYKKDKLSTEKFVDYYEKLIDWNYQPMPPEPEYLLSLFPTASATGSELYQNTLTYYQQTFKELFSLLKENPSLFQTFQFAPLNSYRQGLADTLLMAWKKQISSERMPALIKFLSWPSFIEDFKGKLPEFLTTIWPHMDIFTPPPQSKERAAFTAKLKEKKKFLTWLREAYIYSGFSGEDVDFALQYYVQHIMDFDFRKANSREIDMANAEQSRKPLLLFILSVLPDATMHRIAVSPLSKEITTRFGIPFDGIEQQFILKNGKVVYDFAVNNKDVERIAKQVFESVENKGSLQTITGPLLWEIDSKPGNFFPKLRIMPENVDTKYKKEVNIVRAINLLEMFNSNSVMSREKAWEIGFQKIDKLGLDTIQWKRIKPILLSEEEIKWKDGAESCKKQLFHHFVIAISILKNAILISPDLFFYTLFQITKEVYMNWFDYEEISFESKKQIQLWARNSIKLPTIWKDLLQKLPFMLCSCFPDVKIQLQRLADTFFISIDPDIPDKIDELIQQGRRHPSPFFKINIVLLLLHIGSKITEKDKRYSTEYDFWTKIKTKDKSIPLYKEASLLIENALGLSSSSPEADNSEGEYALFIFPLANFFCYQWQEIEAGITDSERYYSLMAASIIIGELVKDDLLASRETRTAIINKLGWNVRVKEIPGFYQPYLAKNLNYPVVYLTKAFQTYISDFEKYFYTDAVQNQLLNIGIKHSMAYYFIGSNKKSNVTWLDDLFDTSPTGGISAFLKEIAGSSSVFWTEEQQNFLKIIEDIQMLDIMQAANIFINMILNSDQKAISLVLDFLNILFLGLVKREHETEMYSILLILLQEEFIQKLQQLPYIYPVFIERLYSLLYVQEIPAELKTSILEAILPPHPEEKILDEHLPLILRLLYENTKTEAVFSWIETTVKNPDLDFNMRRKIVRFLTERIMQFTPAFQLEFDRIFSDLVTINEWHSITELDNYRR